MYPFPDVKLQYFAAPQTSDSFDKVLQHIDVSMQGDFALGLWVSSECGDRF